MSLFLLALRCHITKFSGTNPLKQTDQFYCGVANSTQYCELHAWITEVHNTVGDIPCFLDE